jgi:ribonuclease G
MVRRILINVTPTLHRIAITEDGRLAELFTEGTDNENQVGNIYLGRVSKILQGMNAAFIDIGLEQDAFLHFSDVDESMEEVETEDEDEDRKVMDSVDTHEVALRTAKAAPKKRLPTFSTKRSGLVTINLQPKQMVLVQVTREAYHDKGVRVTTKVGLTGRNVVFLPFDDQVGVSRKVYSGKERRRLRTIAKSVLPQGTGCIIRTAAAGLADDDIKRDFQSLVDDWKEIEEDVRTAKGPMLLHEEAGIAHGVIRDLFKDDVQRVIVDDRKMYRDIKAYVERTAPHLHGKVELFADTRPMFEVYGIEKEVHATHQRRVNLKSGGSIVIDHTEAMVVVDVNSGRASNERTQENNAVKTNFEAAREVAKQMRLRDIGGIIMVDFIDMQREENRRKLIEEMKNEVARDRAKTIVYPITQLGIMQITRQRVRKSMAERTSEQCPLCFGTGKVQSPQTTVGSIDRWLRNFRARTWKLRVTVQAHPYVVHYMERNKRATFWKWLRNYFLWVRFKEDDTVEAGEFRCLRPNGKDITKQYL